MDQSASQLAIEHKGDYLLITVPPFESLEIRRAQISAMYDAVDEHKAARLLIDSRTTHQRLPILDLYELCIYLVTKFTTRHPRMAVIVSPEVVYPDRFGENVVRNRGLDLIRFIENEQEALDWLLLDRHGPLS